MAGAAASLFTGSSHTLAGRIAEAALFYGQISIFAARSSAIDLEHFYPLTNGYLRERKIVNYITDETQCLLRRSPLMYSNNALYTFPVFSTPIRHERTDPTDLWAAPHIQLTDGTTLSYGGYINAVRTVMCNKRIARHIFKRTLRSVGVTLPKQFVFYLKEHPGQSWLQICSDLDLFALAKLALDAPVNRPNWLREYVILPSRLQVETGLLWSTCEEGDEIKNYEMAGEIQSKPIDEATYVIETILAELFYACQRYVIVVACESDSYLDDLIGTPLLLEARAARKANKLLKTVNFAFPQVGELVEDVGLEDRDLLKLMKRASQFREWFSEAKLKGSYEIALEIQKGMAKDTVGKKLKKKAIRWSSFASAGLAFDLATASPLVGTAGGLAIGAYDAFLHDRVSKGWNPSMFLENEYIPAMGKGMHFPR